jgi:hypothetical protein
VSGPGHEEQAEAPEPDCDDDDRSLADGATEELLECLVEAAGLAGVMNPRRPYEHDAENHEGDALGDAARAPEGHDRHSAAVARACVLVQLLEKPDPPPEDPMPIPATTTPTTIRIHAPRGQDSTVAVVELGDPLRIETPLTANSVVVTAK